MSSKIKRGTFCVLLFLGLYSTSAEDKGTIGPGDSAQDDVAYEGSNLYTADVSGISLPFEMNIQLEVEDGDADLYVSDQGVTPTKDNFVYSSVSADASRNESVLFLVESAVPNVTISVVGSQRSVYVLSFTVNTEDAVQTSLPNATTVQGEFVPGFFQRFNTSIPEEGFYKVTFNLFSEAKESRISDNYLTLRLGLDSNAVSIDKRADYESSYLNAYAGSTWEMRAERGQSTEEEGLDGSANFAYVYGGYDLSLSLFSTKDNVDVENNEDPSIPFSLEMVATTVDTMCLGATGTKDLPTQEMRGQSMMFFSMDQPHQAYIRIALVGLDNDWWDTTDVNSVLSVFVSNNATHPMTPGQSYYSAYDCMQSECVVTIPAPEAADVPARDSCGATVSQLYIAVMSMAEATHKSRFTLSVLGLDDQCGWRPSCESCSQGGSECSWCSTSDDGIAGYCSRTSDEAYAICEQVSAWCVEEACSAEHDACNCMAMSGCGWCGNSEHPGSCAPTNEALHNSLYGYCETWLDASNSSMCGEVCSLHDDADDTCTACAADQACGLCVSSGGISCLAGDNDGAETNNATCDSWFYSSDVCAEIFSEPEEVSIQAGEAYSTYLVGGADQSCGLDICDHATFAYTLPEQGVLDVQVALTVSPADAGVTLYARLGETASSSEYDQIGVKTYEGSSYASYLVVTTLCDATSADTMHFAAYTSADKDTVVEIELVLTLLMTTITIDTEGPELVDFAAEYGGTGSGRHYMVELVMPEDEEDHKRELRTEAFITSQSSDSLITLYARYGACASSEVYDYSFTQEYAGVPVYLNGLMSSGANVRWFFTLDAGDASLMNYTLTLLHKDQGGDDNNTNNAESWVVWLTVALCIVVIMLVSAGYLYYDYTHKQSCYSVEQDEEKGSDGFAPVDFISPIIGPDFLAQEGLDLEQEPEPSKKKDDDEDQGVKVRSRAFTVGALPEREGIPVRRRSDLSELVDTSVTEKRTIPDIAGLMASIRQVSSHAAEGFGGLATSSPARKSGPGGVPPPPPPPPPGGALGTLSTKKRRMTAYGELTRDPNVVREFQNLRKLDNKFYLDVEDSEDDSDGRKRAMSLQDKTKNKKGDLLGELKKKSTHHVQVEQERKEYETMLTDLSVETKSFSPRNMDEAVEFIEKVDQALNVFSDEREVLKGMEDWPETRVDLLREAAAMYKEITSMKSLLIEMNGSQVQGESFYAHAAAAFDRIQKRVEVMAITQDGDLKRFRAQAIPWSETLLDEVIHSSLKFGENYLMKVLTDVAAMRSQPRFTVEMDEKVKWLLDAGVRTGFRVHQFAGGFNPTCTVLFNEVAKLRREQMDTASQPK